jgi:hypothetical protein
VPQTAADQDTAALLQLVGIREIHLLFRQKWAQMFVDLLERSLTERSGAALLRPPFPDFAQHRPIFNDLDADQLFKDPTLGCIVCELGLFGLEAFIHCHQLLEFFDICAGFKATRSINAKTLEGLSEGSADGNRSLAGLLRSVSGVRAACPPINVPPCPLGVSIASRFESCSISKCRQ